MKVTEQYTNTKALNLLIPYALQANPDGSVSFLTSSGVRYTAEFTDASYHFDDDLVKANGVAEFCFGPDAGQVSSAHDPRIELTLIYILQTYFANSGSVLLYVCESLDGRQRVRKRVFNRWFKQYGFSEYDKYDFELVDGESAIIVSIITPSTLPHRAHFLQVFEATFNFYTGLK